MSGPESLRHDADSTRAGFPDARSRRHTLRVVFGVLAMALSAFACGGTSPAPAGHPHAVEAPADWIAGTWDVIDARGAPVGSVLLRARRLTTATSDGWYTGQWRLETTPWPWELHLRIDEGEEAGVRVVLGQPLERALSIVPLSDERLLVLQHDGVWAQWVREPAPSAPAIDAAEIP